MEKLHYTGLLFLNFTILNIIFSLLFFIITYLARKVISSTYIKSRLFFLSLTAPPVLASFIVATSFIPPVFVKQHNGPMPCLNEPYCYIFSFIPQFPLFNAALIAAVILVLMSGLYSIISLFYYLRICRKMRYLAGSELSSFPDFLTPPNNLKIKVIDTPVMLSFVWGYFSSIIVISTGTLKSLSPEELRCLFAHEASHCRRRDNLLKGILLLCRNTLFVFPHVHLLFRWWREEIELIGDEAAVLLTGKPMDVASAILKVQLDSISNTRWNVGKFASGFITSRNTNALTKRVERLVAIHDSNLAPGNAGFSLIPSEIVMIAGLTFLFPLLFGMIYETDPLMLHCYLESLTSVL